MTGVLVSVLAALATLAVVLLVLRLPRVSSEGSDERVAAVTIDMTRRMETLRRDLGEALERAEAEAGRQRSLGELAGATGLETVLRRALEGATALTEAEAALVQAGRRHERRVVANLGLAPEEARSLSVADPPDGSGPGAIALSYRYSGLDAIADEDRITTGLAVPMPGEGGPIGYLSVFTRSVERTFGESDVRALEELAARAGPAIENARLVHEARELVEVDEVTGLANRRRFAQVLTRELGDVARRYRPLSMILFDLDDFRAINRRLGLQVGDSALRETAERGRQALGGDVIFARIGGDEFGVILPGATLRETDEVSRRLRSVLAAPPTGRAGTITFSAGIAQLAPGEQAEAFLTRTDGALHRAQGGGSGVVVSEPY